MLEIVISDASVLIILDKINHLELLNEVYGNVYTTPEIVKEYGKPLPFWVKISKPKDSLKQKVIETQLDQGESSAIALALENQNSLIIIDDLKARKYAKKLGLACTGTLGVINKAKELGVISEIKPIINQLQQTNFRISDKVIEEILNRNNEKR